ncbi:MAG: MFS transporter [Planctomycetota bacterium]
MPNEREYRRRIRAWILYDWANSAFATTILAAVLPVFYDKVAGANLPSAVRNWTLTLSLSLAIVAVIAPVLGTMADVMRGKKRFLGIFVGIGVLGTSLLVFVGHGDWLLASAFFVVGRVGFAASNVFYDSLLPHVARPADQDRVSAQGYAFGYLGGGVLLAINAVMLTTMDPDVAFPLTFLSVAVWWGLFSIPIFLRVPEPEAAERREEGSVVATSFRRLGRTFSSIRKYRQLFRFLIAFLVYNDGIGTIIGVAAIYGASLGFSGAELILAILLVQFVGIPFSLVFGGIASAGSKRRAGFLAFVLANVVLLPVVGVVGAYILPPDVVGARPAAIEAGDGFVGEGAVLEPGEIPDGDHVLLNYRGRIRVTYAVGPGFGTIDGGPDFRIDTASDRLAFRQERIYDPDAPGRHEPLLRARGGPVTIEKLEALPAERESDLALIFAMLVGVQAVAFLFAVTVGRVLFAGLASRMTPKSTIVLALCAYFVIAVWGFALGAVMEFWFLAFFISIVQGGSQAISRSLYAALSPKALSGEFFGLFSVMAKFSAILGPLVFVASESLFGGVRPAMLGIAGFFVIGLLLLSRVDVEEGRRVAAEADARAFGKDGDGHE